MECCFQLTFVAFGGILLRRALSMVFSGSRHLLVVQN
jgi:hypothetical protein